MTPRFAWPQYRSPWVLQVDNASLNGDDAAPEINHDHRRVHLNALNGWDTVLLDLSLTTTEQHPEGLDDFTAFVLASSPRTNTRIPLKLEQQAPNEFGARVELHRDFLAGAVHLEAQLVSSGSPARLVGSADAWTLVVNASEAPPVPGAPPFDMAWIDFSSDDAPQVARTAQDSYAVMDLTGNKPILLLNSEIKGLQGLLNTTKAQLERRRLRDTLATSIARYALGTLFREARAQITIEDDDEAMPPENQLLQQVCEAVAREMRSISSVDELYRSLGREAVLTQLDRARLWVEIDNAIDRLTGHSEMIASVVEEVRHG